MSNPRNTKVEHHHYINNCMGMFYRGTLNYFASELYPFRYKVIATYNKAVEFFNKKLEEGQEIDSQILPAITLDPSGEFLPDERSGRFMWQYPNLYPSFGAKLFDSIYKDNQIMVTPVFTRFSGTLEMICWLSSVYEYIDFRTLIIMWSGGINRVVRPEHLWSYIVMPDEILNYEYKNNLNVGEQPYQIDWRSTESVVTLIRNMNQEKIVYPVLLSPWLQIESISDGSQKHPGTDLASYKLSISFRYEIDLPTFLHVKSDWKLENIKVAVNMGDVHTQYGLDAPVEQLTESSNKDVDFNLQDLKIYQIDPDQAHSTIKLVEGDHLTSCPISSDIIDWNPIASGRLVYINTQSDWDNVEPGDIIYSSHFNDDVLPQMRLANGFISTSENLCTYIKTKASLLQKPVIMGLTLLQCQVLQNLPLGTNITIDPYTKKIYKDLLDSSELPRNTLGWGRDVLDKLISDNPGLENEIQKQIIPKSYMNGSGDSTTSVFIQDMNLSFRSYYEFTDYDLNLTPDEPVHITLPDNMNVTKIEELILVTYIGRLSYGDHFDFDFNTQIITLKIPPKENAGVEMYYYQ